MAQQIERLEAKRREETGKRRMRRLRQSGQIPAVIYGHGEESLKLSVPADQLHAAFRHGSQMVELTGDLQDSALINEVQWDTYGVEPLHIDLIRVSRTEKVDVTVQLELRGVAPGIRDGGVVTQPIHEIEINCPAFGIPENIEVNINSLELDGTITAGELELPEGATLLIDKEQVVAQCVEPTPEPEEEEEAALAAEGAEPEVVGQAEEAEEGGEET